MKSIQLKIFLVAYIFLRVSAKMQYHTVAARSTWATPFVPRVLDKTCLLVPETGPCRSEIPMYYYVPSERNCSTFTWGGCQGNGNRFETRSECLDHCLSKPNERKGRPKFCNLSYDYGYCFGDVKMWYYDRVWKTCKKTIYSGCGGNRNNFYSIEQCESVCRFGNGRLISGSAHKHNMHKVLIVNPVGATAKRGRVQTIASAAPKT